MEKTWIRTLILIKKKGASKLNSERILNRRKKNKKRTALA